MNSRRWIVTCLWLQLITAGSLGAAAEWWQFRGPQAGHVEGQGFPLRWGSFFDEPLWKTQLPGKGWSSPIVIDQRIWLTSAEQVALDTGQAAEKLAELPLGARDLVAHATVRLMALELDAETGQLLRRIDLFECPNPQPIHAMNSHASPTPTTDGGHVYCHFGALGTACIEIASGQVLWSRQLVTEEITGGAASPVLHRDCLYLSCDGADQQYVIALDKLTGTTRWKVDRPSIKVPDDSWRRSFSTPVIVDTADRCQLISMSAQWLISYNPADGSQWWQAKVGEGYSAVPTPVCLGDLVLVCTGFTNPELVAVDISGSGDVTETAIRWRYTRQVPEISSPIIVGQEVYFASSQGVVTCLDVATGKQHWQQRLGGNFAASPIVAEGRIYFTNNSGVTTVIAPGHEYIELEKNELFGESFASLAIYHDSFLLRTNPFLFRLGKRPAPLP